MPIHAALHHVTHYQYDRLVGLGPQTIRLRPAPHCRSNVISYSLKVEPAQHFVNWQQDPFANYQARLVFPEKTREFKVTVDLVVEMAVYNPFDFFLEPEAENIPFNYSSDVQQELAPYLATEPMTPLVQKYLDKVDRSKQRTIDFLVKLNQQVSQDIRYLIRLEPGVQTAEETLQKASGSCRDSGWLLVQLLRHLGLAARFVSGYLIQLTPDVKALDGPSGTDHDFTDLHAWCEVYLPGAGWIGLDATSGLMAGEGHIPLACTPQPSGAAPIEGGVDKAEVDFSHEMRVTRIYESPRVTKPYTEDQWQAVLALGEQVDADLVAGDVRLTMGGEPTFVAVGDRDAPEWNTDALGPTKRGFATELTHKLRAEYGQGGFLHFGQGKWYPGEQLPRWALSICWRTDGQPAWQNPALFADERDPSHYTSADAERFVRHLTRKLGVTDRHIQPGYEDTFYYLWRERRLPVNVDPFDARLDDELERAPAPRVRAKARQRGGLCAAAAGRRGRGHAGGQRVEHRAVVLPRRPHAAHPRRFAHGLPPAARCPALGEGLGHRAPDPARPDRAPGPAARCDHAAGAVFRARRPRHRRPRPALPGGRHRTGRGTSRGARHRRRRPRTPGRAARPPCGHAAPGQVPVGRRPVAHRAVRGGARPAPRERPQGREGGREVRRALRI